MPNTPKVSPALQTLLDKGLLDRLPVSFAAFCFDQMMDGNSCFRPSAATTSVCSVCWTGSNRQSLEKYSSRCAMSSGRWASTNRLSQSPFTLEQVDFLNRNPHYAEWRAAVAGYLRNSIRRSTPRLPAPAMRVWS